MTFMETKLAYPLGDQTGLQKNTTLVVKKKLIILVAKKLLAPPLYKQCARVIAYFGAFVDGTKKKTINLPLGFDLSKFNLVKCLNVNFKKK